MSLPERTFTTARKRLQRTRCIEDALSFCIWFTVGIINILGLGVTGYYETIMSAHFSAIICMASCAFAVDCFFLSSFIVTLAKPKSRFTSCFSDFLWMPFSILFGLGSAAYGCVMAADFGLCESKSVAKVNCELPLAGVVLAWFAVVYTFILLCVRKQRYSESNAPIKMSISELAQLQPTRAAPPASSETVVEGGKQFYA